MIENNTIVAHSFSTSNFFSHLKIPTSLLCHIDITLWFLLQREHIGYV